MSSFLCYELQMEGRFRVPSPKRLDNQRDEEDVAPFALVKVLAFLRRELAAISKRFELGS